MAHLYRSGVPRRWYTGSHSPEPPTLPDRSGVRTGHWEVQQETVVRGEVRKKGSGAKGRWVTENDAWPNFELVRIDRYESGQLIETVKE